MMSFRSAGWDKNSRKENYPPSISFSHSSFFQHLSLSPRKLTDRQFSQGIAGIIVVIHIDNIESPYLGKSMLHVIRLFLTEKNPMK